MGPDSVRANPAEGFRSYQDRIATVLERDGRFDVDPAEVEGWMRLEYGVLDHLDASTFRREALIGAECASTDPEASRELARSYGLTR